MGEALRCSTGTAGFTDEDEIAAIDRYGSREDAGLTVYILVSSVAMAMVLLWSSFADGIAYLAEPAKLLIW